jgi:hypothetical protein
MNRRETLELVRAYYRINGDHVRRRIYELTKSLASAEKAAASATEEMHQPEQIAPPIEAPPAPMQ